MSSPPPRGWSSLQSKLLLEVKAFDRHSLQKVETRVKNLLGEQQIEVRKESMSYNDLVAEEEAARKMEASQKLSLLKRSPGKDKLPCKVSEQLYIGSISAARNLKALRKRGITHILNASALVPCYFKDNPEGAFTYCHIPIYDDASVNLSPYIDTAIAFIETGRKAGGVLVHCYAGQSRSAAFILAYFIGCKDMSLADSLKLLRHARPSAQPNSGFLHQLAEYESTLINGDYEYQNIYHHHHHNHHGRDSHTNENLSQISPPQSTASSSSSSVAHEDNDEDHIGVENSLNLDSMRI